MKSKPSHGAKARATSKAEVRPALASIEALNIAGTLRERLNRKLDLNKVPSPSRAAYLAMMTGRAAPSCRRWLDERNPGLPDLKSFAALCLQFEADANDMLGFDKARLIAEALEGPLPTGAAPTDLEPAQKRWVELVSSLLGPAPLAYEMVVVSGDEMQPRLSDGDIVFVDRQVRQVQGNGTYHLEYQGRSVIRHVEDRLTAGLVLSCENSRYEDIVVPPKARGSLRVLGRVRRSVSVSSY